MKKILLSCLLAFMPAMMLWGQDTPPADAPKITFGVTPGVEFDIDLVGSETEDATVWVESDGQFSPFLLPKGLDAGQTLKLRTVKDEQLVLHGKVARISIVSADALVWLDATNNTFLQRLNLNTTPISSVILKGCSNIDLIYVDQCGAQTLDITGCSNLIELSCLKNELQALDITQCPNLVTLKCGENGIEKLDFSKCPNLKFVHAEENKLTVADLSNNPLLEELDVDYNSVKEVKVANSPNLRELHVGDNKLTSVDVSKNTKLENLKIDGNNISSIDLTGLSELKMFNCHEQENGMETLDLTPCSNLQYLVTFNNKMKTLKLPATNTLLRIECYKENLETLDVTKNEKLVELFCEDNQLKTIDLSKNTDLRKFRGRKNPMKSLDLSNSPLLTRLEMKETPELTEVKLPETLSEIQFVEFSKCNLDACAIDGIINALNDKLVPEQPNLKKLFIKDNPGTATSNTAKAIAKHWVVDATGDATGCPQSIEELYSKNVEVRAMEKGIYVQTEQALETVVYSVGGEILSSSLVEGSVIIPVEKGTYVVRVANMAKKVIVP